MTEPAEKVIASSDTIAVTGEKVVVSTAVPERVSAAIKLLCAAILFSIISFVMNIALATAPIEVGGMAMMCAAYALIAWLVLKISLGRNWARIVFTMILALEIGRAPLLLPATFHSSVVLGLLDTVGLGLQIAAVAMLWMKASEPYFEKKTQ
jgi:hypothetical protein